MGHGISRCVSSSSFVQEPVRDASRLVVLLRIQANHTVAGLMQRMAYSARYGDCKYPDKLTWVHWRTAVGKCATDGRPRAQQHVRRFCQFYVTCAARQGQDAWHDNRGSTADVMREQTLYSTWVSCCAGGAHDPIIVTTPSVRKGPVAYCSLQ